MAGLLQPWVSMGDSQGIRLLRIRGVDLRLHFSLIILLAYVVMVASMQFPQMVTNSGVDLLEVSGSPVSWGLIFAVGLLTSVALHEFGHVLMAQRLGVKVKGVTLMMLGGISQMEKIPEDQPYGEFKLAVVGPIVSLVLGIGLLMFRGLTGSAELSLFGYWLGSANVALAIFNLLPAYPLDGGRALRSLLSARMTRAKATLRATRISRGIAWGLAAWGLLSFNLLLVLISLFIFSAAKSEAILVHTKALVEGMTVGEVAVPTPVIDGRYAVSMAAEEMLRTRMSILPVRTDSGWSLIRLDRIRALPRDQWSMSSVALLSDPVSRVASTQEPLSAILPELLATPLRALPVEDGGRVIGLIRQSDLEEIVQLRSLEQRSAA